MDGKAHIGCHLDERPAWCCEESSVVSSKICLYSPRKHRTTILMAGMTSKDGLEYGDQVAVTQVGICGQTKMYSNSDLIPYVDRMNSFYTMPHFC